MSADAPTPLDLDAIPALAAECDLADRDMRKWVRCPVKHLRSLLAEVKRLRAELDQAAPHITYDKGYLDGAARPAPAWDEEAVTEAVARRLHADACSEYDYAWESNAGTFRDQARELLAVVREYLPVKPDRETVARALRALLPLTPEPALDATATAQANAALDLWPGRSEAEVKAEALRDFAGRVRAEMDATDRALGTEWATDEYRRGMRSALMQVDADADRLAAEGGDDRE